MGLNIKLIFILFSLFENKTEAKIRLVLEDSMEESIVAFKDCIDSFKRILYKSVVVSDDEQTNYFAPKLLRALDIAVSLVSIDSARTKDTKYLAFSSEQSFYDKLLIGLSSKSKTTVYIIWPWTNVPVSNTTLEVIFSILWTHRVYSFMALIEDKNHDIHFYSHFSYRPNQCGTTGPPIYLDTWVTNNKEFSTGFFFNFMGLLRNFHRCPLKILVKNRPPESYALMENGSVRLEGISGKILTALMQKFNFSITIAHAEDLESGTYLRDKYGYVLSNYSKDKIVQALSDDKFDMAFGVFPFVSYFSSDITLSFFHLTENYAFYVPCGTKETPSLWRFYYVEFSYHIWVAVILFFFVFSCFMKILSKLVAEENSFFSSFWGNTFIVWAIHMENTANVRTRSTTAKAFLVMVMFYSMIISVAYRASLKSFLMAHLESKSIETWEELDESGFEIAGLWQDFPILHKIGMTHHTLQKLSKKFKVRLTGEFSDIVHDLAAKHNTAFFGSERMFMHYYSNLQEEYGSTIQRVCQVGQFVSSSPASSFIVRRGSPFYYMVDQLTINEIQTGHMTYTEDLPTKETSALSFNENQKTFSLKHLKGTFFLWIIGIVISLIALIIELLYFKLHPNSITLL